MCIRDSFETTYDIDRLREFDDLESLREALVEDAVAQYEAKETEIGAERLREIERRVMLSVLDRHWREHLYEMDYLQEGINLRAMGQKDPLVEWQREGYDMFEAMMGLVADDFVKYVFHLEVVKEEPRPVAPVQNLQYSAPEDPVQGSQAVQSALGGAPAPQPVAAAASAGGQAAAMPVQEAPQQPVHVEKTPGRNEPCYCGSGKKFKFCHGR